MPTTQPQTTWEDYHPQLAAIFSRPKVAWPCERVVTAHGAHQPQLVTWGKEIFAQPGAAFLHSGDGGRSWSQLCDIPMEASAPADSESLAIPDAIGVSEQGTFLFHYTLTYNDGRTYSAFDDPSRHEDAYVVRSTDRGRTWSRPMLLDPAPHNCAGTDRCRFVRLPAGEIALATSTHTQCRSPGPAPFEDRWFEATLFVSADDGLTWTRRGVLPRYTCEVDLLPLPSGRLLAAARYQRLKLPDDPPGLVDPISRHGEPGGHSVLKQTVLTHSDDGGRTWSEPRLLSGWLQQTACLVRLADGTLVLPFGFKTENFGQRFLLSFDEGQTWTRRIHELDQGGLFASSVGLEDGTIVTAHDNRRSPQGSSFTALRWQPPTRSQVEEDGFFEPFAVHEVMRRG